MRFFVFLIFHKNFGCVVVRVRVCACVWLYNIITSNSQCLRRTKEVEELRELARELRAVFFVSFKAV